MNDNPLGPKRGKNPNKEFLCRDGHDTCEDCRKYDISKIKSVHFTLCQKPWICPGGTVRDGNPCKDFHANWFRIRKDWEKSKGIDNAVNVEQANFYPDVFLGYCKGFGERNYKTIDV